MQSISLKLLSMNPLVLVNGTSSANYTVRPNQSVEMHRGLWLRAATIRGVPVTASVPDYDYYLLNLEVKGSSSNVASNVATTGYPIRLTNSFTTINFDQPICISRGQSQLNDFRVTVKNPDGTDALFTSWVLWLEYC